MAAPSKTGMPIGGGGRDTTQLAIAAEELIKAACTHVDSTSLTLGKDTVEGLKKTVEGLKEVLVGLAALKLSNDTKLNTLNQSISTLEEEIVNTINIQSKVQKLQWAITNAGINTFEYYDKKDNGYSYTMTTSTHFTQAILLAFQRGEGWYIDNRSMSPYCTELYRSVDAKVIEDGEKQS